VGVVERGRFVAVVIPAMEGHALTARMQATSLVSFLEYVSYENMVVSYDLHYSLGCFSGNTHEERKLHLQS
jgi:hypothetical protein